MDVENMEDVDYSDILVPSDLNETEVEEADGEHAGEKVERLSKLPLARIKHIMKTDPEVNLASQEAVFLISKATELFIKSIAKEAFMFTTQAKKKTVQRRDVDSAISAVDSLTFLEGAIEI